MTVTDRSRSRAAVRRLALARVISITGGAAAFLALNFSIYERTGSATWLAAALFLTFGTTGFASPFAGALGDRFNRQKVMIASDLAGAAFFLAMALVHGPAVLLALAFGSAVAEAPFISASSAAIPNLVEEEDLGWANSLVTLGRHAGILVGPLLGGVLVATIGVGAVFAANAVSFVVSAALVASVHGRFNEDRGRSQGGLRAGFRFLAGDRVLRTIALAWLALVLGVGMTMVADLPLVKLFGSGSFGYGILIAFYGGGAILGSLLWRWVKASFEAPALLIGTGVAAFTAIVTGLSPWFAMALGAIGLMGIGDGISFVAQQVIFQRRTPDAVRSRVSGAFDAVVHVGLAMSYVVGGPMVAWLGPRVVYVVGGVTGLIAMLVLLPVLRDARTSPALEPETAALPAQQGATDAATLLVP